MKKINEVGRLYSTVSHMKRTADTSNIGNAAKAEAPRHRENDMPHHICDDHATPHWHWFETSDDNGETHWLGVLYNANAPDQSIHRRRDSKILHTVMGIFESLDAAKQILTATWKKRR